MQHCLVDFSANQSCPELSAADADSLYCSLSHSHSQSQTSCSDHQLQKAQSFPLLSQFSESVCNDSGHDLGNTMTSEEDDAIEILSCHVVEGLEEAPAKNRLAGIDAMTLKLMGNLDDNDPTNAHRKRVARAVGVVTFLLLLFSVILIGISLNMSKNIDEMVLGPGKHTRPNYARTNNRTLFDS